MTITFIIFIYLFIFTQTMHALPIKQQQQQVFETGDNIIITIPKPIITHNKYHTVSCFQDITEEEEDLEDLMFLLEEVAGSEREDDYDEEDEYYYEQGYQAYSTGLLEPLSKMVKNIFHSWFGSTDWSFWDKINHLIEERNIDQFQFYFDA
jgi:hypothetical protein